jgi:hypothetical protein
LWACVWLEQFLYDEMNSLDRGSKLPTPVFGVENRWERELYRVMARGKLR